jgi:predicted metallopeptidase
VLHWREPDRPLPSRTIRATGRAYVFPTALGAPPWLRSGEPERSFDFCASVKRLCTDIAERCAELSHIDSDRVLFAMTQARNRRAHGLQARVTPLRFPGGKRTLTRRGLIYQVQRYIYGSLEYRYLVTFCLPRFLDQDFDDKLVTLFHELYHISPAFDGDLRRHKGRYALHTHSQSEYDRQMAQLARAYLSTRPDPSLLNFLRLNFTQLQERHGSVCGVVVPRPKIIPVGTVTRS